MVPELQARGHYWNEYDGSETLRERIYDPGQKGVREDHPAAHRRALEVVVCMLRTQSTGLALVGAGTIELG